MALDLPGDRRKSRLPFVFGLLLLAMLAAVLVYSYRTDIRLEDVLGNMARKNELISQMKTDLLRSVEAEKNAVLADTDEESQVFAKQAMEAAGAVEQERGDLGQLIEAGRSADEMKLLGEFDECWTESQKIDKVLLDLAVRNTNLKAGALASGKGTETFKLFEQSLAALIDRESSTPAAQQVAKLAYAAVSDAFVVYSLQAPHIIASSNENMDKMEAEMHESAERVKADLASLAAVVSEDGRTQLSAAEAAFNDFLKINSEVIALSRQNTNVKSMELSLGAKRKVTAQCRDALSALQRAVGSKSFKATR